MAGTKSSQGDGQHQKKVLFKIKVGDEYTEYRAVYGDIQIEGHTMGDKKDIKYVVRRIILAPNELPDYVVRAAIMVTNHISSAVHSNSRAWTVWAGVGVEFGDDEQLKLSASLYYYIDDDTDEAGWAGEVVATFSGYDGLMVDASHSVIKNVDFGPDVDVVALYRMLLAVARHAYNAYPAV
jgi:hypothetical protein